MGWGDILGGVADFAGTGGMGSLAQIGGTLLSKYLLNPDSSKSSSQSGLQRGYDLAIQNGQALNAANTRSAAGGNGLQQTANMFKQAEQQYTRPDAKAQSTYGQMNTAAGDLLSNAQAQGSAAQATLGNQLNDNKLAATNLLRMTAASPGAISGALSGLGKTQAAAINQSYANQAGIAGNAITQGAGIRGQAAKGLDENTAMRYQMLKPYEAQRSATDTSAADNSFMSEQPNYMDLLSPLTAGYTQKMSGQIGNSIYGDTLSLQDQYATNRGVVKNKPQEYGSMLKYLTQGYGLPTVP